MIIRVLADNEYRYLSGARVWIRFITWMMLVFVIVRFRGREKGSTTPFDGGVEPESGAVTLGGPLISTSAYKWPANIPGISYSVSGLIDPVRFPYEPTYFLKFHFSEISKAEEPYYV